MLVAFAWVKYAGSKAKNIVPEFEEEAPQTAQVPGVLVSFLPVIVPIMLIGAKSFISVEKTSIGFFSTAIATLGDPVIALCVGVVVAFLAGKKHTRANTAKLLQEAAEKAGGILVIIGAGGAFGAILAAAKIGQHFSQAVPLGSWGLLFPFLLTALLKTAQGSSTVAIITASSIIKPLLATLGLAGANGALLCVLSMGAGSMAVSHANDAYFWVIAKFSGLETRPMLRVYSFATLLMGITAFSTVYLLSFVLL
jgi:GntP family gluconate:H+ symporter